MLTDHMGSHGARQSRKHYDSLEHCRNHTKPSSWSRQLSQSLYAQVRVSNGVGERRAAERYRESVGQRAGMWVVRCEFRPPWRCLSVCGFRKSHSGRRNHGCKQSHRPSVNSVKRVWPELRNARKINSSDVLFGRVDKRLQRSQCECSCII